MTEKREILRNEFLTLTSLSSDKTLQEIIGILKTFYLTELAIQVEMETNLLLLEFYNHIYVTFKSKIYKILSVLDWKLINKISQK